MELPYIIGSGICVALVIWFIIWQVKDYKEERKLRLKVKEAQEAASKRAAVLEKDFDKETNEPTD